MKSELLDELHLSMYEELSELGNKKNITLVKEKTTDTLYVKKVLSQYDENVYASLQSAKLPGIPEIHQLFHRNGELILIEEYINGQTLSSILKNSRLEKDTALSILLQLEKILTALHTMEPPIIHRDIKAENILLTKENTVYLIDFNAARNYNPAKEADTVILGTNGYAPPEQYGFAQTDCRSDVYSLAVLFHIMLTGKYPNEGISCRKPIDEIIRKATSLSPKERFDTVKDFVQAITCAVTPSVQATQATTAVESARQSHRKWTGFIREIPGFRQKKVSHMLGALFLYYLIINIAVTTNLANGYPVSNAIDKVLCALMYIFLFFICADFRNIRKFFPGTLHPHRGPRYLILFSYWMLGIFVLAFLCTLINWIIRC